jgi:hypothetical protein
MVKEKLPFKEKIISQHKKIRVFYNNLTESELKWHIDKEDRLIKVLNQNDWMIQIDNKLPENLNINKDIYIPKDTWHRIIAGKTKKLFLEINFL